MRLTAAFEGKYRGAGRLVPAPATSKGTSVPAPVGGWDAYSPISAMPPQNALTLINWFPQPGWIELRKGFLEHCDTASGAAVDSIMSYQAATAVDNRLFAASGTVVYDATSSTPSSSLTGMTNPRWQYVNFAGSGGHFLWMCNGEDTPQFWDGATWTAAVITGTGVTPEDMVDVVTYRARIWTVLKNSSLAAYLPLDSVQGAATTFDLGGYFSMGGELRAIGTWSASTNDGPDEFIVFVSEYGQCAVFNILDPTSPTGIAYNGTVNIGSPLGRRCLTRAGADLAAITLDGLLPFSKVGSYDEAVLIGQALTQNIQTAMSNAAQEFGEQFGWQVISYPKGNMAILNVPIVEGASQEQYVMNTITGKWARFTGMNANCWAIFENNAYFGGNDGLVRKAFVAAGDENQTLEFDIECAYNYYGVRGHNKQWTTARLLVTRDSSYEVLLQVGISVDFQRNDALDDTLNDTADVLPIWDDPSTLWDEAIWPGIVTEQRWFAISGIGYASSLRIKGSVEWSDELVAPQTLRINSYDALYDVGGFI